MSRSAAGSLLSRTLVGVYMIQVRAPGASLLEFAAGGSVPNASKPLSTADTLDATPKGSSDDLNEQFPCVGFVEGDCSGITDETANLLRSRLRAAAGFLGLAFGLFLVYRLLTGEGPAGRHLVAVRPGNEKREAEIAYHLTDDIPYVPTPIAVGELLFLWSDSGVVTCLKLDSGEQVWQQRVGGSYYSSPVCIGDRLYCVSKKGEIVSIRAAEKYELLGRLSLQEKSHATPAIFGEQMFVRTYTHLIAIVPGNPRPQTNPTTQP